jgi:DNA-binding MarR family transcriptional regulator
MKQHEYRLLEAIAEDETVTQASLAHSLEMAVGSVNWYIKRLISRGYLKATRMDRTRLRYNLTAEGMRVFQRRATQYVKDSLQVYHDLREQSKDFIAELRAKGIERVYIDGNDPTLDIFKLSCLETGFPQLEEQPGEYLVRSLNGRYRLERSQAKHAGERKIA